MNKAFSLVELSIVLVILGLLTGGILAGQNLIRAAEIRSVSTQINQYTTAIHTFRDKYFALPGDMRNATKFWGAQTGAATDGIVTACANLTTPATSQATCNGNGDGYIGLSSAGHGFERFRAWQHLANAGLIEGTYDGIPAEGGINGNDVIVGDNSPRGRISNAGVSITHVVTSDAPTHFVDGVSANVFVYGGNHSAGPNYGHVLSNEEAWNIDTKMDDGLPAQGSVFSWKTTSTIVPNCATNSTSAAEYDLTRTGNQCSLFFIFIQ